MISLHHPTEKRRDREALEGQSPGVQLGSTQHSLAEESRMIFALFSTSSNMTEFDYRKQK